MSDTPQLPALPSPTDVVSHIAIHFAPAVAVGIVSAVLLYQNVKAWVDLLTKRVPAGYKYSSDTIRRMVEERKRATIILGIYSALAVGCSYVMAVLINASVILAKAGQSQSGSWAATKNTIEGATWTSAAAWTVGIEAAVVIVYVIAQISGAKVLSGLIAFVGGLAVFACGMLALGSLLELLDLLLRLATHDSSQSRPTGFDVVSQLLDIGLCIALGLALVGIASASGRAFKPGSRE